MNGDVRLQTQRRKSNLYAFRRLKWGNSSARFALQANRKCSVSTKSHTESPTSQQMLPVSDLANWRRWARFDHALWLIIAGTMSFSLFVILS